MIGKTVSHYKILEKLGEGGMGVVYKAEDTKLKRTVALKFLPKDLTTDEVATERFEREAQATAALNHPNIVTIYEISEFEDQIFIAMEYVEGMTLNRKITGKPLSFDDIEDFATQICEGLRKAHEAGIVHRDIKPGNILIDKDNRIKILDFGLAKLKGVSKLTKEISTLGTIHYISPEQARGNEVDHRSDIWSLGVILYEMITGQVPFKGEYEQAVIYSILNEDPRPMKGLRTGVPIELERVVNKALAKDPSERYQTAPDLLADFHHLQRITASPATPSNPKVSRPTARPVVQRLAWIAALIFVVTVVTVLLIRQFIPSVKEAIPERKMLVVLPFENLGPPEDEYFADGITEEITSRLAALRGLGVISRTSAFYYKETKKTLRQIGEELKVDYVLEGTVRWERVTEGPSRVRVTPQLIRVSDDTHLWTERYDEQLKEIFTVQSRIAEGVAQELNLTLLKPERRAIDAKPTENLDAYQAYLKGLEYSERGVYSEEDRRLRVELFQRAVELDSNFALAWAALSRAHLDLINLGMDRTQERVDMAKGAIDRVLELLPDSPEAHLALGYYFYYAHRDYERALEEFALAGKGLPNSSDVLGAKAWIRRRQGRWNEAIDLAKQAFNLNPRASELARELGNLHLQTHEHIEAVKFYDRSIALAPDQRAAYVLKAVNYWFGWGDLKQARETLEAMPERMDAFSGFYWFLQELYERKYESALDRIASAPVEIFEAQDMFCPKTMLEGLVYRLLDHTEQSRRALENAQQTLEQEVREYSKDARIHSSLGMVYAALGRREEAIREGKLGVELYPVSLDAMHGPRQVEALAIIYMLVGDHEVALDKIEYLLSIPSGLTVPFLRLDPQWDPLRDHPRFQKLIETYSKVES